VRQLKTINNICLQSYYRIFKPDLYNTNKVSNDDDEVGKNVARCDLDLRL